MNLVNVHCHMLFGVDDGARTKEDTAAMLEAAYNDGVRGICMTPHFNPAYFHTERAQILQNFEWATDYAAEHFPDLRLFIGQELFFRGDCLEALNSGECISLNGTRHVLVEFEVYDDYSAIFSGLTRLLTSGYIPVLAHIERYSALFGDKKRIEELYNLGVAIQVNASSVIGKRGSVIKRFVRSLIKSELVDIVADDCHNMDSKPPCLGEAYAVVCKKFGDDVGRMLFHDNPLRVISMT